MSNARDAEVIQIAVDELTYIPSGEQRKAKFAFWARFNENPICDPSEISLSIALRLAGDNRLNRWWPQEGFRAWFCNKDEWKQRLEYLAHLSLDSLESVLIDPKAQSSAKVNAAKLLIDAANKMPSKGQVQKYLDEQIGAMDRKQLEEYINSKTVKLPPPTE